MYDIWYTIKYYIHIYHASNMTACTHKTLQGHYNITCRMLYVERSEAFAPLIIFILVVWNFSICLIEPIRLLGCTSVPVPMYQCMSISIMYQRNVPGIWPTRSTRLPGPTYQAQPGPTRTYQNPALPGLGLPKDHTLDHILFWQPPKTPPKQHTFFDTHLKKQKHTFYTVKCMFSLKSPKIGFKKNIKILSSNSWPSKNIHFTM